jgi:hypothetical protein
MSGEISRPRLCGTVPPVRWAFVIFVAIGVNACQPPQAIDRLGVGTSSDRASGGRGGSGGRAASGEGGVEGGGAGTGGDGPAGAAGPDAAADPGNPPSPPPPAPGAGAADAATPLTAIGGACADNGDCASGACVDGICCNTKCEGACQACDVAGNEGTCTPVPKGEDPDDDCAMDPPASCKQDGTCDGQGACARYAAGSACMPGSCTAGVEHAGGSCSGQGQCLAGASQPCKSGVCNGASCGGACTADAQCQAGFFCDGGTCKIKLAMAAACTTGPQCASGHCVDKVCCASDCAQGCYACNLAGSVGSCIAIADGQDPAKECVAEAPATCGRVGGCNGRGACKLQPMGVACAAGSCADAVETSGRTCNGVGMCQAGATKACGNFTCKGAVCATTCAAAADCKPGLTCVDGACVTPPVAPVSKIDSLKVNDTANAGGWSTQKNFQIGSAGARPWSDRGTVYVMAMDAAANGLLGADWIKVVTESKKYNGGPQAAVTLKAAADVYLAVDDRWGDKPAWLAGWTNTGWKMTVFDSATKSFPFTLYAKLGQTGTVTVPAINNNDAYNYFIVVK